MLDYDRRRVLQTGLEGFDEGVVMALADKKVDVEVADFSGDFDDKVASRKVEVLEVAHFLRLQVDLLR